MIRGGGARVRMLRRPEPHQERLSSIERREPVCDSAARLNGGRPIRIPLGLTSCVVNTRRTYWDP